MTESIDMRSLKVLLVLLSLFYVSLSMNSEDELRVVVRKLERLIAKEKTSDRPWFTGTKFPPGPHGKTDKNGTPYKLHRIFDMLLRPYFGSAPSGDFQFTNLPLTREQFVKEANDWYMTMLSRDSSDLVQIRKQAFFNMTSALLKAIFQCPTAKINQMVFYVLKDQERVMTEEDQNMYTYVRNILENQITNNTTRENVARMIVKTAHRHIFGDFMEYIKFFYFKDIMEFFGKMKILLYRARQEKWSVTEFDQKLNELLLSGNNFDFKCPRLQDLWDFHRTLAVRFQQRYSEDKHLDKAREWLTKYLVPRYLTSDPAPVIKAILQVYKGYVRGAVRNFDRVETHMTTGNMDNIIIFVSEFLNGGQLEYLKAIFEYLKATDSSRDIDRRRMGSTPEWDTSMDPDSGYKGYETTESYPKDPDGELEGYGRTEPYPMDPDSDSGEYGTTGPYPVYPDSGFGGYGTTGPYPVDPDSGFGGYGTTGPYPMDPDSGFGGYGTSYPMDPDSESGKYETTRPYPMDPDSGFGGYGTSYPMDPDNDSGEYGTTGPYPMDPDGRYKTTESYPMELDSNWPVY
ncbi:uncharacterized protein LOC133189026 [Saccostrea echinata]|uniref:uncharacterized protein LOC133189026 n=2 Tax=Saccostrea echinata TaxID=191078 RepID=UPI002A821622|nr:uncharacterized protein LOC133189026 [Saccostrea echinata]